MPIDTLLQLNFYIDTRRKIQLHQRIDRFIGRIDDIHETQMRPNLELITGCLIDVRRAQDIEALDARRQRHRPAYHGSCPFSGIHDFKRRLIDQSIIEGLKADTDFLILHVTILKEQEALKRLKTKGGIIPPFVEKSKPYSMILATTPAPTVRPPSRIAKRRPSSIAIGAISFTVICTLSPGITISTPAGSSTAPVTSVVRK